MPRGELSSECEIDEGYLTRLVTEQARISGLLDVFKVYVVRRDQHSVNIIGGGRRGMREKDTFLISLNNSNGRYPFKGNLCSHLDFTYDPANNRIRSIKIKLWPPLEGRGYGRKLIETMEKTGAALECIDIRVNTVTNPPFFEHLGYRRIFLKEEEYHEKTLR